MQRSCRLGEGVCRQIFFLASALKKPQKTCPQKFPNKYSRSCEREDPKLFFFSFWIKTRTQDLWSQRWILLLPSRPHPQAILSISHIYLWLQRVTEWMAFTGFLLCHGPQISLSLSLSNLNIWPLPGSPRWSQWWFFCSSTFLGVFVLGRKLTGVKREREWAILIWPPSLCPWFVWFSFSHQKDQLLKDKHSSL